MSDQSNLNLNPNATPNPNPLPAAIAEASKHRRWMEESERQARAELERKGLDYDRVAGERDAERARADDLAAHLAASRETNRRLNERCGALEKAVREKIEAGDWERRSLGRGLANAAAELRGLEVERLRAALEAIANIEPERKAREIARDTLAALPLRLSDLPTDRTRFKHLQEERDRLARELAAMTRERDILIDSHIGDPGGDGDYEAFPDSAAVRCFATKADAVAYVRGLCGLDPAPPPPGPPGDDAEGEPTR